MICYLQEYISLRDTFLFSSNHFMQIRHYFHATVIRYAFKSICSHKMSYFAVFSYSE